MNDLLAALGVALVSPETLVSCLVGILDMTQLRLFLGLIPTAHTYNFREKADHEIQSAIAMRRRLNCNIPARNVL